MICPCADTSEGLKIFPNARDITNHSRTTKHVLMFENLKKQKRVTIVKEDINCDRIVDKLYARLSGQNRKDQTKLASLITSMIDSQENRFAALSQHSLMMYSQYGNGPIQIKSDDSSNTKTKDG